MLKFSLIVGPSIATMFLLSANLHTSGPSAPPRVRPPVELPSIPLGIRPLTAPAAVQMNASIPFSNEPILAAKPFQFTGGAESRERAIECLTSAVYYEAGQESREGQEAVAQVILNRVRNSAFPASVCGVVFDGSTRPNGCQFSFTCDGSLTRVPEGSAWARARQAAEAELSGAVYAPIGLSTHYHADYVVPYWATVLVKNVQIGAHIFYSWRGSWGTPVAFLRHAAPAEPDPVSLVGAALMSHGLWRAASLAHSPAFRFHADPMVELTGVVDVLARSQSTDDTAFEGEMRKYFAVEADHPVVQLFRHAQGHADAVPTVAAATNLVHLASMPVGSATKPPDPQPDGTAAYSIDGWMRDFAEKSNFAEFLRSHRGEYALASKDIAETADRAAADWNAYTGIPLEPGNITFTLTLHRGAESILPPGAATLRGPILWSDRGRLSEADLIAKTGAGAPEALKRTDKSTIDALTYKDIVTAVFMRIAALSGKHVRQVAPAAPCAQADNGRAVRFATKLGIYETHRDKFPTLADFVPLLISGESPRRVAGCAAPIVQGE